MHPDVKAVADKIGKRHLAKISKMFVPGAKLTLLIRIPGVPYGDQDLLFTDDDDWSAMIEAIRLRRPPK